ncbi:MAG: PIN domain-containing protein [Actinomycetia bacterium]|nr:PIN domain-containing protein [Actinomycetes bacterium]
MGTDRVLVLNTTRAEALIHPTRLGRFDAVDAELDRLGFETCVLDNDVANRARQLQATHGNKNFPMVDAAVVALGVELGCPVITADTKWPEIPKAAMETISLDR